MLLWQLLAALLTAAGIVWTVSHIADWLVRPKGVVAVRVMHFLTEAVILLLLVLVCLALLAGAAVGALWWLSR
ncbi:MAG: hypothetical protein NZT92_12680 [Abditibacteriales bacterium]|nr:hypothetical protein [Abditibacteriales bacterium]MDW8366088.1 hypothetical protein [Abditibacteriales bacterium]